MTTEHEIEGTLRSLAEAGGLADEDAAWQAIVGRIENDARQRRRNRLVAGGLVTAAAAAGLVVAVAVGSSDDVAEPIDVGPAESGETTAPTTEAPAPATAALPRDPVALVTPVTPGNGSVQIVDGETGDVVATPVTGASLDDPVLDTAMSVDGTVFVLRPTGVSMVAWDGAGGERPAPIGPYPEDLSYASLAVSPDGRTVAAGYLKTASNSLDFASGILLGDLETGEVRRLDFPAGDARGAYEQAQQLSFSPDGQRVAFVNVHDNDGTEGFDGFVVDVHARSLGESEQIPGELWSITFTPDGGILVVEGDDHGDTTLHYVSGGPDVGVPPLGKTIGSVHASQHAIYATVSESSATFRHEPGDQDWDEVPFWDPAE